MEADEFLARDEVAATLFAIHDINAKLTLIIDLREEGIDGEEPSPEDDT